MTTEAKSPDVFNGLPRRIQIGPNTFRVQITNETETPDLEGSHGLSDLDKFRIYLSEGMEAQLALEVVQHEVSHCINSVYGITDDSDEETFTTQNSKGLADLQLRNPRYVNWLVKTIRRARKEAARD